MTPSALNRKWCMKRTTTTATTITTTLKVFLQTLLHLSIPIGECHVYLKSDRTCPPFIIIEINYMNLQSLLIITEWEIPDSIRLFMIESNLFSLKTIRLMKTL